MVTPAQLEGRPRLYSMHVQIHEQEDSRAEDPRRAAALGTGRGGRMIRGCSTLCNRPFKTVYIEKVPDAASQSENLNCALAQRRVQLYATPASFSVSFECPSSLARPSPPALSQAPSPATTAPATLCLARPLFPLFSFSVWLSRPFCLSLVSFPVCLSFPLFACRPSPPLWSKVPRARTYFRQRIIGQLLMPSVPFWTAEASRPVWDFVQV